MSLNTPNGESRMPDADFIPANRPNNRVGTIEHEQ